MRVSGLAFVGLVVGAFMASPASLVSASMSSSSNANAVSLNQFFSSDAPESLHEAKNQGTMDEPKAWPEANAWLHAQLSDAERDFLALEATGTVDPNANLKGGLTDAQITDPDGVVTVTVRVTQAQPDLVAFRNAVIASIPLSSANSVSAATGAPAIVTTSTGPRFFSTLTFQFFSNGGTNTAGQQFVNFASQFAQATSALRTSNYFANNIDLNAFPTAVFTKPTGAPTVAPTPSQAAVAYCTAFPTTCLNGGTCVDNNSPSAFNCICPADFIGTNCQFSLKGANRRASGARLSRGKSVTRPKPKIA